MGSFAFGWLAGAAGAAFFLSIAAFVILMTWFVLAAISYAGKENFKAAGFFFMLTLVVLHLFGFVDVINFVVVNWMALAIGVGIYLAGSWPYTYFVEWKFRKIKKLYDAREEDEKRAAKYARRDYLSEERRKWFDAKQDAYYAEQVANGNPIFDEDSPQWDSRLANRKWEAHIEAAKLDAEWKTVAKQLDVDAAVEKALTEDGYRQPIEAGNHKAWIVGHMVWWPLVLLHRVAIKWVLNIFSRIYDLIHAMYQKLAHTFQGASNAEWEKRQKAKKGEEETPETAEPVTAVTAAETK